MTASKAERLLKEIDKLKHELRRHQVKCKHPDHHRWYTLRGSSGHYDPQEDSYWTEYFCNLCKHKWVQSNQFNLRGTRR